MAEPPNKLRTRKLERIERIVSTDEPFDVPADFDPNELLAGAWSIWFDEDDQPTRSSCASAATRRSAAWAKPPGIPRSIPSRMPRAA